MCLLCGWREADRDMLIIHGVLHANFVYTLGPASESGAGRWLLSLHQSLEESLFYGYLCLFCCLTMVAIVTLVKAKHGKDTEKVSFDAEATTLPRVAVLSDGTPVPGGGSRPWSRRRQES